LNREFEREANTECSSDTAATLSDYNVGQLGDHNPPLHRQPAPLASLELAPSMPPRYRKYEMDTPNATLTHAPGHRAGSLSASQGDIDTSRERECSSHRLRPELGSPPGRLAAFNILQTILSVFRLLWRRLRKVGGVIFKKFTKDI
jgi:hypothetical protein